MKRSVMLRLLTLVLALACLTGSVFAKGTGSKGFTDVQSSAWYYSDVMQAVQKGLVNGKTATTYCPDDYLTYAEAVKLAACLAQRSLQGSVTLTNSTNGDPWYMTYAYFAIACDIEVFNVVHDAALANSYVTREDFVAILYGALNESAYTAINTVEKNAIPDYAADADYAREIYGFYRAGILTGDADGSFRPRDNIKRSEVAAILTRMTDATTRKSVTLTAAQAPAAKPNTGSDAGSVRFAKGEYLAVAYLGICGPGMYSPYDENWYKTVSCFGYDYTSADVTLVDMGGDEMYFLMANPDYGPMAIYTTEGEYYDSGKVCFVRCGGPEFFARAMVSVGAQSGGVNYTLALSGEDGLPVRTQGVVVLEVPTVSAGSENYYGGYEEYYDTDADTDAVTPLTYPQSMDDLWTDLILTYDGLYGNDLWVWADEVKYEYGYIAEYLGSDYNYILAADGQFFVPNYDPADQDGLECVDAQNFAEYVRSFPRGVICEAMVRSNHEGGEIVEIYQAVVLDIG